MIATPDNGYRLVISRIRIKVAIRAILTEATWIIGL